MCSGDSKSSHPFLARAREGQKEPGLGKGSQAFARKSCVALSQPYPSLA